MQRFFDLLLSTIALLLFVPLVIPIALLLRLTGEGEIFYRQQRIGKDGRQFGLYKFATMLKDSPNLGTGTITVSGDSRILPVGEVLRRTKLNELPQILNVLVGDMSLIGPRPLTQRNFELYAPDVRATVVRVRPGLSGVGSIVFRDEERLLDGQSNPLETYAQLIAPYKGELECWYVAHQGMRTYFVCILATFWAVISPRSTWVWKLLPTLPQPSGRLKAALYLNRNER